MFEYHLACFISVLFRHSGSIRNDSVGYYPESPSSKPQTGNLPRAKSLCSATKQGDSGYFLPLHYRKFRNDVGRGDANCVQELIARRADQANRPYADRIDKMMLKLMNFLNYSILCLER